MDFLLEVGVEELPASYVDIGVSYLKEFFEKELGEKGVKVPVETYGTPRRLAVVIKDLPEKTEEKEEVIRGPVKKVAFDDKGRPTKALEAFLERSGGSMDNLVEIETKKGVYVGLRVKRGGESIRDILPGLSKEAIVTIPFPKSMRWKTSLSFGRPIRWLVAILDGEVLPLEVDGVKASRFSFGHRFLQKGRVELKAPSLYLDSMRASFVEPSKEERKRLVVSFLDSLKDRGLEWVRDEALLDEVVNLVEYPFPVLGRFHESYLELPEEVIVNVLKVHQKFFSFMEEGRLSSYFVGISNNRPEGDEIREGYERVVAARLNDAFFFLKEDLKVPFGEKRLEELKEITFFQGLGSMYDKTVRLMELGPYISELAGVGDAKKVKEAAFLSKMDLTTNMVYEFPELQGVMGRYYAKRFGEEEEIAEAIFEHYLPRFSGDELPRTETGIVLSLADKIDTLVGFFGLKQEPTGSADPHGLRRAALGVVLTVVEKRVRFDFFRVLGKAFDIYKGVDFKRGREELCREVFEFLKGRMENIYSYRKDVLNAVFSLELNDLYSYHLRAVALGEEREKDDFMEVFIPFKRVMNITKGFEGRSVDPSLFEKEEEKMLYEKYMEIKDRFDQLYGKEDFKGVLSLFREIKPYVDRFFDNVFVMVEDERLRNNRLSLLRLIADMFVHVADFTKLSL